MTRRAIRTNRLIAVMGVIVLALGAAALWAAGQGAQFGPDQPTATERALVQLRELIGPGVELRYTEAGQGRALCGYARRPGARHDVAFISRPNRLMLGDDPLKAEFAEMQRKLCPGFIQRQRPAR
jgi:hypothetical protein